MKQWCISLLVLVFSLILLSGCATSDAKIDDTSVTNGTTATTVAADLSARVDTDTDTKVSDTDGILRVESETENFQPLSTTSSLLISRAEAKNIALTKAEVTAEQITDYEIELDHDEVAGCWEYEISFNVGRVEYECEIRAENGQIIYWITDMYD